MYRAQNNSIIWINGKGWVIYKWDKDSAKRKWKKLDELNQQ